MSRFPLELYFLVLEAIGYSRRHAGDWDEQKRMDDSDLSTLQACNLVCGAWHHHTTPYIWASVAARVHVPGWGSDDYRLFFTAAKLPQFLEQTTFTESLELVQSNPKFVSSIRHFALDFSACVQDRNMIASPELLSFCKTLAPFPSFRLRLPDFEPQTILSIHFEVLDDDEHPLGQILASFCHSSILTSFAFEGEKFPFDILKSMPNLKDVSFKNVFECIAPHIRNQPSPLQSLPFRLRRARFLQADSVYTELMMYKETLFELEELEISNGDLGESANDEDLAVLLSIPKDTLKTLSIELNDSLAFARAFVEEGLSLYLFRNLEKCSIDIRDFRRLFKSRRRSTLLGILEAAPTGFLRKLESFSLSLSFVAVSLFDKVFDPEARGWQVARHLLGPNASPSLRSCSVDSVWSLEETRDAIVGSRDRAVNKEVSARYLEMVKLCVPGWEDDARGVERGFKVEEPLYIPRRFFMSPPRNASE